ncbi:AfsA-related hotdog domain-containing protein [Streptomyces sp. NPDC054766]
MSALRRTGRPNSQEFENRIPELFEQSVPRGPVHRAVVPEFLLAGWLSDEDPHRLGARRSCGRSRYGSVHNRWRDPMLLAEPTRQTRLLLAHETLRILTGHHFLTESTPCRAPVYDPEREAADQYSLTVRLHRPGTAAGTCRVLVLADADG